MSILCGFKLKCLENTGVKVGFTLAEVLITLAIIGVVASLTVSPLVRNIQDAQYKAAWKKAYSDIDQATLRIITVKGRSMKKLLSSNANNNFRDLYADYLNYIKKCDVGAPQECWPGSVNQDFGIGNISDDGVLVLASGTILGFDYESPTCTADGVGACGRILVDINGTKEPNELGYDRFGVHVLEHNVIPIGSKGGSFTEDQKKSTDFLYQ